MLPAIDDSVFSPLLTLLICDSSRAKERYITERGMIHSRRIERNKGARMNEKESEREREREREREAMVLRHNTNVYDFSTRKYYIL